MTIEMRQQLQTLEAAVTAQLQALHKKVEHLPQPEQAHRLSAEIDAIEWIAEDYEGRAGAPTIAFTRVKQIATELRETFDEDGNLSFAQQLALDYISMMLR